MAKSPARRSDGQLVLFDPNCADLQHDAQCPTAPAHPEASAAGADGSIPRGVAAPRRTQLHTASERNRHSVTHPTREHSVRPAVADVSADDSARSSLYLQVEDVAERLHCSRRTVHELTRTLAIPHRRLPGCRRCLFRENELDAWESGAPLEVTELPRGGRLVVPRRSAA